MFYGLYSKIGFIISCCCLIIVCYNFIINAIAFFMFGTDKRRAVKLKRRISEAALIAVCILGGSAGGLAAMAAFHHKTNHKKFTVGVPVILLIQWILYVFISILTVIIAIR